MATPTPTNAQLPATVLLYFATETALARASRVLMKSRYLELATIVCVQPMSLLTACATSITLRFVAPTVAPTATIASAVALK
mmetsp:Transcript_5607/g.20395  ORF Transcript_5607/g.20395 Transcript_5607/m.20395 type:complete len:82 (-) Transcript_5607:441-686(-)